MLQPNPLSSNSLSIFYDLFKSDQSSSLHVKIQMLNNKIEGVLTQYHSSNDVQKGYDLLVQLENKVNTLFEHYQDYQFEESDINALTNLCRRINEDPIFQEIRESFTDLLLAQQLASDGLQKPKSPNRKQKIEKENLNDVNSQAEEAQPQPSVFNQEKIQKSSDKSGSLMSGSTLPTLESVDKMSPISSLGIKEEEKDAIDPHIEASEEEKERRESDQLTQGIQSKDSISVNDIQQLFVNMKEEYGQHKIDPAYEFLQKIKSLSTTTQSTELRALIQESKVLMDEIEMFYEFSMKILHEMEDEHGYCLERVKNNFDVKYKSVKGERLGLKMEGIVNVSLFNFLALINEPEGYTKWMPFCSQARLVKQINRATKSFYIKCSLPPPICGREMYGYGGGFDRLQKNGSILLVSKSINLDHGAQQRLGLNIPSKSKTTRMEMEYMGVELYPIGPGQPKMKMVLKFDPKIKYLPLSFVNWHVRKLGHIFVDRIVSRASNFKGSLWERKIQENRELYGFLEERFNQFLQSKNF